MKVSIKAAAQALGVREETLRRWEQTGKITSERTAGGHRRYDLSRLGKGAESQKIELPVRVTIGYARVSSQDQLPDLLRQASLLEIYCSTKGWEVEVIQGPGSGLNYPQRRPRDVVWR